MHVIAVLPDLALSALVAGAAGIDLLARRIPNRLVGTGLLIALALHLMYDAGRVPSIWLGGALTGFAALLPLYLLRGMAAGDVKLMAMVGAFVGPAAALAIGLLTCLIGGLMALLIVLRRGGWDIPGAAPRRARAPCAHGSPPLARAGGMPYGLAIALATWALLGWRHA